MPDVRDQIRESRPQAEALTPLDLDEVARRARRRTVASRGATALTVAAVVVGTAIAVDGLGPTGHPTVGAGDLADQPAGPDAGPTGSTAGPDGASGDDGPEDGLADAIERLIEANRQAAPHPVPGDGEIVVQRTYALWGTEAAWYELRIDGDGTGEVVRAGLGTIQPTSDRAALREQARDHFAAGPPEAEPFELDAGEPAEGIDLALREADSESRGSAEPRPGSTQRPDQMHAFMLAADALRTGLQPDDRIRALEAIGRLDPRIVEYRGMQRDLLGRQGIAIAGRDGSGDAIRWNVLIFDPETGDLLGEYDEQHGAVPGTPVITTYTARETLVLETDS